MFKIHKGNLNSSKILLLESNTHKIYKTEKPLIFAKLKSCLSEIKMDYLQKNLNKRIEWAENESDNSRKIVFDIEEMEIIDDKLIQDKLNLSLIHI